MSDTNNKELPMTRKFLPTDNINAEAHMDAAVQAATAECSPAYASSLRAAWADMSDVIRTSIAKMDDDLRVHDHTIAWVVGQSAAAEGASESLTVALLADAIEADRMAGRPAPSVNRIGEFFEEGPAADAMDRDHPELAKVLDGAMT